MKKRFNRLIPLFALLLGVLGVVVCAAAIVVVWSTGSRLSRTNERVFDRIDVSLAAVRDRILGTKSEFRSRRSPRKTSSKRKELDARENKRTLGRDWKSKRRLRSWLTGLRQAHLWVETSEASILDVHSCSKIASASVLP